MRLPIPIKPEPGEESVWDYPRPPRLERVDKPVNISFGGAVIVDATGCYRVLETSHPPVYYLSPDDIQTDALKPALGASMCEWKGRADYFDVVANGKVAERAAWRYVAPTGNFAPIAGYVAFTQVPWTAARSAVRLSRRSPAIFMVAGSPPVLWGHSRASPGRWAGDPPLERLHRSQSRQSWCMTQGQVNLARMLTYAGILPPWLALIVHLSTGLPWSEFAALTYGAVIASFVCGMHWGLAMQPRQPMPVNLLITSNAGALAAWSMLLASMWSTDLAFLGLAIVLGVLLLIDRKLLSATVIEPWFWSARCIASIGLGAGLILWSIFA